MGSNVLENVKCTLALSPLPTWKCEYFNIATELYIEYYVVHYFMSIITQHIRIGLLLHNILLLFFLKSVALPIFHFRFCTRAILNQVKSFETNGNGSTIKNRIKNNITKIESLNILIEAIRTDELCSFEMLTVSAGLTATHPFSKRPTIFNMRFLQ